ncbi:MAG: tetratricopeptide repeat protein, partial [Cyanobacteria bacterium]|nr:tetratricopeptide repeat protein [Cyanobacteriota bacterium]
MEDNENHQIYDSLGSMTFSASPTKALWVNCGGAPSFNSVSRWILQEMGFLLEEATADEALSQQLVYRLTQKRCLVVIDQMEAIAQKSDWPSFQRFLAQWQAKGRQSSVLLTTRQPVLTDDRYRLDLAGFTPDEGAAYLSQQGICAAGETGLSELSRLGLGHPLLLKLAASWLRETANGQLEDSGLSFFEGLFQQNPAVDTSVPTENWVAQVFQALLAQLAPLQRQVLLAVSVYRRAFSLEQAQAMEPQVAEADLAMLTGQGLLVGVAETWTLHPLVKALVSTALQAAGQETAAHQSAIAYFSARLQRDTVDLTDVLDCFHHHCELSHYSAAFEVIGRVYSWLDRQGSYPLLCELYGQLVTAWQTHPPSAREAQSQFGEALNRLGLAYQSLGEYQRAIDFQQQSLEISREIGDRKGEANSLNNLAIAYHYLGKYQRAIDFQQQSLEISREIGDRKGEANSLSNLGSAYHSLGDYQRAIDFYQQFLEIKREIGDSHDKATSLNNLGNAYQSLGDYRRAIDFHQQSLAIKREIGDRNGEADSLNNLGNAYQSLGEYRRTIDFHQQSLAIKREIGDRHGEAQSLNNLGAAYQSLGEYRRAINFHQQSLAIKREIGDRNGEANALNNLGAAYQSLGEYRRSIDFHQQSSLITRETGDRKGEADSLNNLGAACQSLGEYLRAIDFYEQSLVIKREICDRHGEANSLFNRAIALAKLDDHWATREGFEQARALYAELQLPHKVEKCDEAIQERNKIIAAQPRQAPTIGLPAAPKPTDDWWQKSLPSSEAAPSRPSQQPWLFYLALVVAVIVLIVVVQ